MTVENIVKLTPKSPIISPSKLRNIKTFSCDNLETCFSQCFPPRATALCVTITSYVTNVLMYRLYGQTMTNRSAYRDMYVISAWVVRRSTAFKDTLIFPTAHWKRGHFSQSISDLKHKFEISLIKDRSERDQVT